MSRGLPVGAEVEVVIRGGWIIYYGGRDHRAGETVTVDRRTAVEWIEKGWARSAPPMPVRRWLPRSA